VSELASIEVADLDGARLVRVAGEIDLSNARTVMEAIGDAAGGDVTVVVVDLSETAYLDSAGIAMIFRLAERLGYSRQQLRLVVPSEAPIRAVLELTNLPTVIPVQESVDAPDPI
jgi:anti-sigma B factor antagonist